MSIFEHFPDFEELQREGFAGLACIKPAIMIAMTPRTGSTHLCAALEAAGDTGPISEIFNPRGIIEHEKNRRGVTRFAEYVNSFNAQPGTCFIFKTCWRDFTPIAAHYRNLFPNLRVIYLDRRNIAAQAVSFFRAVRSGYWHRPRNGQIPPPPGEVPFNQKDIFGIIANLETEKRDWEQFFSTQPIQPMRLFYEAFTRDIVATTRSIGQHMALDFSREIGPQVGYDKLADELNEAWVLQIQRHLLQMT